MNIMPLMRPVIKVIKDAEIPFNFGIPELRDIQLIFPEVLKVTGRTGLDFTGEIAKDPNNAVLKLLNELILKDWDSESNKAGDTLKALLQFLDRVFLTETPLEDLQVLDILEQFDIIGERLEAKVKKNSKSTKVMTPKSTVKSLSTTETEKKLKKKNKVKK